MKIMSTDNFRLYSRIAFSVAVVLFICGIVSFIYILLAESSLRFDLSSQGFAEFFRLYAGPLSFLGASLFLFTAWLTLVRTEYTQRQIDLLGQNNRFNNYYKHIEQFTSQFSTSHFIRRSNAIYRVVDQNVYLTVYREFYYRHPLEFAPKINIAARQNIQSYLDQLISSRLNQIGFDIKSSHPEDFIPHTREFYRFGTRFRMAIEELALRDYAGLPKRLEEQNVPKAEIDELVDKFTRLNTIYWTYKVISSLLVFDGEDDPVLADFIVNHENTRSALGI